MDRIDKKVLIADDEPLARERLSRLLENLPGYTVCAEAVDGNDTLAMAARLQPDILLLDIHMPGMDGMVTAERLVQQANPPALIFCTAHEQHALEAFDVNATAYLLKPVRKQALADALARSEKINRLQRQTLEQRPDTESGQVAVRSARGTELIDLADIRYCQADQKYVTLHHGQGETLCDYTLKELEQAYPDHFLRIHRHTLAGVRFIQGVRRNADGRHALILKDSETLLPISRRHAPEVRRWLEHQQPSP